jgi:hypothetical protein
MSINNYSKATLDLIGNLVFPRTQQALRRKDAGFLLLSLVLGSAICAAFGCILFVVNQQGRL